jgi:hypothetical protein
MTSAESQSVTSSANKVACTAILAATAFAASCSQPSTQREIKVGWKSVPHVVNSDAEREDRELELREFIFRREIAKPVRDEIVFLSFGYAGDRNWIEPPHGYCDRFSDLRVQVMPVSDAKLLERGLTSKTLGRVGHIYYMQIVQWLDEHTVQVNHALYGGPLYGGGTDGAVYEFQGGTWRLKSGGQHHIE